MNGGDSRRSSGELEALPLALEVLVQLPPDRSIGDAERSTRTPNSLRQSLHLPLGLRVVRDPAEAAVGRRDEQRPDRRVDEVVGRRRGDLRGRPRRGTGGRGRAETVHFNSPFRRSRRMPAEAAWRAASAFEPSAAPIVGVVEVVAVAEHDRRALGRRERVREVLELRIGGPAVERASSGSSASAAWPAVLVDRDPARDRVRPGAQCSPCSSRRYARSARRNVSWKASSARSARADAEER